MSDRDLIIKIKGKSEKTISALNELKDKLLEEGLEVYTDDIYEIPESVNTRLLKTTKTKDICLNFTGKKENIELVLDMVRGKVDVELGMEPDFEAIKGQIKAERRPLINAKKEL